MKKTCAGIAFLIIGLVFLFKLANRENPHYASLKPLGITNVQDHLRRWGYPNEIYLRNRNGTNVYIFIGPRIASADPSGPAAYVYSGNGTYLDWTPDLGDDPEVHNRWSNLWPNDSDKKIDRSEIDRMFPR